MTFVIERGVRLFDDGAFFEAHEAWEEHWLGRSDDIERTFLQGLIQIAAGFHKLLDKHAPESAARLLVKGLAKLDRVPADLALAEIIDLPAFREGVRVFLVELDPRRPVPRLGRRQTNPGP